MATYVMSDIHGRKKEFDEMLEKIHFSHNDKLYILGDYVDWGPSGIELILQLIDMTQQGNTICLWGNHDIMMYDVINKLDKPDLFNLEIFTLWDLNGGYETLKDFMKLNKDTQSKIIKWMTTLLFYVPNLEINGKKYYLCHSKPYLKGMGLRDVVWQRILANGPPQGFIRKYPDTTLISGHTIVKNYNSFDDEGKCKIFHCKNGSYINIDCGAKAMDSRTYYRLACIRLEDLAEFYVDGNYY